MHKIIGNKINKSLFSTHQWVEDIAFYEGPLISFVKGGTTQDFFYYWLDSNSTVNRWLVIPVSRDDIHSYKTKDVSLLEIAQLKETIFTVDIDGELNYKNAMQTTHSDLHEDYLPSPDSYFDPDLCPSGTNIFQAPNIYRLQIDGQWFLEDLVKVPKQYIELYSFTYTLFNSTKESISNNARHIFCRYPWKGGSSTVNFFRDLNKVIPSMHEPQVKSIQYASPGHINLELFSDVSKLLSEVISITNENMTALDQINTEVSKFLTANKYSKIPEDAPLPKLPNRHKEYLSNAHQTYSELMGIGNYSNYMLGLSKNPLVSIKIIRSIYRRLQKLIVYKNRDMIKF